jgi:hypothetical protein
MSATDPPAAAGDRCGKWMPRKRAHCARRLDHKGECRTAEALADHRWQKTERQLTGRAEYLEARRRWNRTSKFNRLGITEEQFNALLEAQGYACAICRTPFGDGKRICADHDHNCCEKQPKATAKTCGRCIRGLLCVKCNTWLGWTEKHGATAEAYLARAS